MKHRELVEEQHSFILCLQTHWTQVGYNRACGLVEMGEFAAAELELKLTIKLGECV